MGARAADADRNQAPYIKAMKRVIVLAVSLMLLVGGLAGCGSNSGSGSGGTSSTSRPGY
jgi:hypothetical protein